MTKYICERCYLIIEGKRCNKRAEEHSQKTGHNLTIDVRQYNPALLEGVKLRRAMIHKLYSMGTSREAIANQLDLSIYAIIHHLRKENFGEGVYISKAGRQPIQLPLLDHSGHNKDKLSCISLAPVNAEINKAENGLYYASWKERGEECMAIIRVEDIARQHRRRQYYRREKYS